MDTSLSNSNSLDSDLFWEDYPRAWHQQLARIVDHRFTTFNELRSFAFRVCCVAATA